MICLICGNLFESPFCPQCGARAVASRLSADDLRLSIAILVDNHLASLTGPGLRLMLLFIRHADELGRFQISIDALAKHLDRHRDFLGRELGLLIQQGLIENIENSGGYAKVAIRRLTLLDTRK